MAYLQKGYWCVWNGNGKIRAGGTTHYPLHRLIYEEAHGIVLPRGSVIVHHINEDKLDNRIENLEALSRSEHPHRHTTTRRVGQRLCASCKEWKDDAEFHIDQTGKHYSYCRTCRRDLHRSWRAENPERIATYNERRNARYRASHPNARIRLTPDQVRAIRRDPRTARVIGAEYGVSRWTVHDIKKRRKWPNLPD